MKKKWKWIAALLALALLAGLWTWQYSRTQAYYRQYMSENLTEYYKMGEFVELYGETGGQDISGFSFRVNSKEYVPYGEYLKDRDMEDPLAGTFAIVPEKLLLVSVTIRNGNDFAGSFSLQNFKMRGTGAAAHFENVLLLDANPDIKSASVKLEYGEEITVVLPYSLQKDFYSDWTWSHIEKFDFRLGVTDVNGRVLTDKWVRINE